MSILLFSMAGLALEVLLMRLFSIVHWHHFAYMIISVALLGFGASGTFVAIFQGRLRERYRRVYLINGAVFSGSSLASFLIAQRVPFNTLEVLWDPGQWLMLGGVYLILAVPFFFLANLFALSFLRFQARIGRIYSADLVGAGLGAGLILAVLYLVPPLVALKVTASVAAIACAVAFVELRVRAVAAGAASCVLFLAVIWLLPATLLMTPYKGLPQALLIPDTAIRASFSSPLGLLSVVESPRVPFRYAPGMSLSRGTEVPAQLGIFTDGDAFSTINAYTGEAAELQYLDALTSALPYHLLVEPRTLIVGADHSAILQAVAAGAKHVDVVEINPQRNALINRHFAEFGGWELLEDRVRLLTTDVRGWLLGARDDYDLIVFPLSESSVAAGAGVHGLMEDFLFTREALALYWSRLSARGMLVVSRWVKLPPRDEFKLINTAITVMAREGVDQPGAHLALIRGWKTTTLVASRSPLTGEEIAAVRGFAADRSFDVVHYPSITEAEVNRFNQLAVPLYADGVKRLLGAGRAAFVRDYPFNISASSIDKPYFFQFFRWSNLPMVLRLRDVGGLSYFEWGYPVLVMTLVQAVLASVVLILAPLFIRRQDRAQLTARGGWVVSYFLVLGFAFMFLEMAFIQRLTLYLHHPVHAAVIVLATVLVFAGAGSRLAERLFERFGARAVLVASACSLAALAVVYLAALPVVFTATLHWPLTARLPLAVLVLAPLSLLLGMPFPSGLSRLAERTPAAIPWAWCINGCASVVSAVAGTLAAVHLGFNAVVLLAAAGYVLAALLGGWPSAPSPGDNVTMERSKA